ncbi:MAG: type II toxin-antitoxin system PemK/MazF family toxin [Verrucomicrobia bacterium]|nr:type II toxin-antitoxin system PemK/MazF family toxin [Verrucomicrobiota bacterium]
MVIERFSIFLVKLDPATGAETAKTRPCVIVSPDELNRAVATVIIAPMTTVCRGWPTRVAIKFQGKTGEIALDQIRAVDKSRLVKRLGKLDSETKNAVLDTLGELFAL